MVDASPFYLDGPESGFVELTAVVIIAIRATIVIIVDLE